MFLDLIKLVGLLGEGGHVVTKIDASGSSRVKIKPKIIISWTFLIFNLGFQDVIIHNKKLTRNDQDLQTLASSNTKGIRSLSKDSQEKLEAYQNLFYLLQTNPVYLAKLIFEMPQSRSTNFMESVILTLYNYASNTREEYLLLKLFETALREEILYVIIIDLKSNCNVNSGRGGGGAILSYELKYLKPVFIHKLAARFFNILDPREQTWYNYYFSISPC